MKTKHYLTLLMILVITSIAISQNFIDNNTSLIDNYFQQENNRSSNIGVGSDVTIFQFGSVNTSLLQINGNQKVSLIQKGENNNYEYYTFYNTLKSDIKINQNGNDNDIQIYGQNELTKNLVINQNTNNQTIIIRNYQ
jgi:hypothetical protein